MLRVQLVHGVMQHTVILEQSACGIHTEHAAQPAGLHMCLYSRAYVGCWDIKGHSPEDAVSIDRSSSS
jgi:hypothetical protein